MSSSRGCIALEGELHYAGMFLVLKSVVEALPAGLLEIVMPVAPGSWCR